MSKRHNNLLLLDILDSAQKIQLYKTGFDFDKFIHNELVIDAVARNFEIIGEAASRIDSDFKAKHPEIEWIRNTSINLAYPLVICILPKA